MWIVTIYVISLCVIWAVLTLVNRYLQRRRSILVKELEKETKKLSELKVKSVVSFPHLQSTLDQMLPCIWERPRLGSVRECCHAEIVEALLGMKGVYAAVTPSLCKICPFRQTHPEGSLLTTPQIIERIEKME